MRSTQDGEAPAHPLPALCSHSSAHQRVVSVCPGTSLSGMSRERACNSAVISDKNMNKAAEVDPMTGFLTTGVEMNKFNPCFLWKGR